MISFGQSPPGFCCQMGGGEVKGAGVAVKLEAAKEEKKEEVVVVEAGEPPLKYKRWILRVSIHCEGCKRKMKKILHSIDGVYTTEIDLRQQKVTVNGDVEADTLIKRLMKMGRHAELWPLKDNKQQGKPMSKDKHDEQESGGEEPENAGDGEGEKDDGKGDGKALEAAKKGPAAGALPVKNSVTGQIKEVNGEVKHMVPVPTGYQTAVSEGEGGAEMAGGGSGSGKKKKKKKKKKSSQGGGNNNNTDEEGPPPNEHDHAYDAPPRVSFVLDHGGTSHPANTGTPCHHPSYQFPSQSYYAGSTPVHTVSYHTSHPCSSYGTSHYYSLQPHSNAYEYVHPFSLEIEHMPSAIEMCSSPAAETFDVLSDENPHACLVM